MQAWGNKIQSKLQYTACIWRLIRTERYDGDPGQAGAAESKKRGTEAKGCPGALLIYVERLVGQLLSEIFLGSWRRAVFSDGIVRATSMDLS